MAEVSWLSDYVSSNDRSSDRFGAGAGQGTGARVGSGFRWGVGGQGIAGLLGIGTEATPSRGRSRRCAPRPTPRRSSPEKGGSTREAKKICTGCEVKAQCLEYALANDERFGIWGGLSERERRRLRRRAV